MERTSRVLTRLMLGLFALLLGAGLLFGAALNWSHKSYPLMLLTAAILVVLACRLLRRHPLDPLLERLGPGRLAAALLLLCLAVNVLWALGHRLQPADDAVSFWGAACEQALGAPLHNHAYLSLFPHIMGYSTFLGLFLRLFGSDLAVATGLNILLTLLSELLISRLCLRWGGLRAAFWGGLLWALCPSCVFYNCIVLAEPFYTCLLLTFLWLVSSLEQRESAGRAPLWLFAAGGLVSALLLRSLNAARPIAAVPLIACGIWILLLRGKRLGEKRSWLCWGLFFALLLAAYIPLGRAWDSYLTRRLGEELPALPGYSIYVGFNPETEGSYSAADMQLLQDTRGSLSSAESQALLLEKAKERISSGQIDFPRLFAGKLRIFLGHDEGGAYYTLLSMPELRYSLWASVSNVFYYAVALLALLGAWQLGRRGESRFVLAVPLYAVGLTLAQMLVEVSPRYHYSIIPMLILLAALSRGEGQGGEAI